MIINGVHIYIWGCFVVLESVESGTSLLVAVVSREQRNFGERDSIR